MNFEKFYKEQSSIPFYKYPGLGLVQVAGGDSLRSFVLFQKDTGKFTTVYDGHFTLGQEYPFEGNLKLIYELAELHGCKTHNVLPDGRIILKDGSLFAVETSDVEMIYKLWGMLERQTISNGLLSAEITIVGRACPYFEIFLYSAYGNVERSHAATLQAETYTEAYSIAYGWCHQLKSCYTIYVGDSCEVLTFDLIKWRNATYKIVLDLLSQNKDVTITYTGDRVNITVL